MDTSSKSPRITGRADASTSAVEPRGSLAWRVGMYWSLLLIIIFGMFAVFMPPSSNSIKWEYVPWAVTVHYDPGDPNQAVLEPGPPTSFRFLGLFLAAFVPLGLIVAWAAFKAARSDGMQVVRRRAAKRGRH